MSWVRTMVTGAAVLTMTACGAAAQAQPPWHLLAVKLPPSIAGFDVRSEPASASSVEKAGGPNSLIDGAALFSVRQGEQLNGVIEISEFKPSANPGDEGFQQEVVGQIGQRVPRPVKVHARTVYEGAAPNGQSIYTWFTGRRMVLLLTHGIKNPDVLRDALLRTSI